MTEIPDSLEKICWAIRSRLSTPGIPLESVPGYEQHAHLLEAIKDPSKDLTTLRDDVDYSTVAEVQSLFMELFVANYPSLKTTSLLTECLTRIRALHHELKMSSLPA